MRFTLIYITTKDRAEAVKIAKAAVEEKLAACANIIQGMTSIYSWNGEINESQECVLILKSKVDLFERLERRIKGLHSYECPCILSLPVDRGHEPYMKWLGDSTI